MDDAILLDPNDDETRKLMSKLMLSADPSVTSPVNKEQSYDGVQFVKLVPKPAFCLKTKTDQKVKVFINVCVSENVPEPKDISEVELIKHLESDDPGIGFRIPMSIGEPHAEMDKGGAGCTVYDVIIHPSFLRKMENSKIFHAFFIQVMREGVQVKYDIELVHEYVILKNRKSVGKLLEQNVRTKSKPLILDMDQEESSLISPVSGTSNPLIQEVQTKEVKKGPEPKFNIVAEPADGHPEFLVAEIHLPEVKTASTLILDIGEDRIVLDTRSNVYYLDIYLPYNLVQEEVGSQFHRKSKILTITMPVQPAKEASHS